MFKREIEIRPTPQEMAEVFAHWFSNDQALFLDLVALEMGRWEPHARLMQCCYIRQDMTDTKGVRFDATELIAELVKEKP